MWASEDAVLHLSMLIAKSLLCDLSSDLGPHCDIAEWSVFSDPVTYMYM